MTIPTQEANSQQKSSPPPQDPSTEDPPAPSYNFLAHGEQSLYTVSTRNQTQFTIDASFSAIPRPPHHFTVLPLDPPQRRSLHYEFTFLSRRALHVRFGVAGPSQKQEPFPDDASFPPAHVREWLCTGYFPTPESNLDELKREGKDLMNVGVELRAGDFNTWVNPHSCGGMEYQYLVDKDGFMGFEGFYNKPEQNVVEEVGKSLDTAHISDKDSDEDSDEDREEERGKARAPLWKLNTNGPFSHSSMPAGIVAEGDELKCFELFEFQTGENLQVAFTDKAVPADQEGKTALEKTSDSDSKAETLVEPQGGNPDLLLFWTDRDWGCLVKKPLPVSIDSLQRMQGNQIMLSVSTLGDRMEYIILVGEALEKMKAEYGNLHRKTD